MAIRLIVMEFGKFTIISSSLEFFGESRLAEPQFAEKILQPLCPRARGDKSDYHHYNRLCAAFT